MMTAQTPLCTSTLYLGLILAAPSVLPVWKAYRQLSVGPSLAAKIVADRFHVIRIIQHHFLGFCRMLVPELKNKRGLLKSLRKNPENLTQRDQERLQAFFTC